MVAPIGPPALPHGLDTNRVKLAQRVKETLHTACRITEPKQLAPSQVRVAPANRYGAPPNVQHAHYGILHAFTTQSFDKNWPGIGNCIKYTSEHGEALLHAHNHLCSTRAI